MEAERRTCGCCDAPLNRDVQMCAPCMAHPHIEDPTLRKIMWLEAHLKIARALVNSQARAFAKRERGAAHFEGHVERLEQAVRAVYLLHARNGVGNTCTCGAHWPCRTGVIVAELGERADLRATRAEQFSKQTMEWVELRDAKLKSGEVKDFDPLSPDERRLLWGDQPNA